MEMGTRVWRRRALRVTAVRWRKTSQAQFARVSDVAIASGIGFRLPEAESGKRLVEAMAVDTRPREGDRRWAHASGGGFGRRGLWGADAAGGLNRYG